MSSGRPDPHRYTSVALLVDLVTNTLDPGYAEAAHRRGPGHRRRWWERPAVAIGCLLIGLILAVAYSSTHRAAPAAEKVRSSLLDRARAAGAQASSLAAQASALTSELNDVRDQALAQGQRQQLSDAELAAGLTAVTGPGVTVTLGLPPAPSSTDTAERAGTVPIGSTSLLTDRDVRAVVNELWSDGAQAISVNNVRLTPTSAIRFAGQAVLVDYEPLVPPYVIRAIGPSASVIVDFADSVVASRYQTLASARGIEFSFVQSSSLDLPAAAAAPEVRYATPDVSRSTR